MNNHLSLILVVFTTALSPANAIVNFEVQGPLTDNAAIPLDLDFFEPSDPTVKFRFGVDPDGFTGGLVRTQTAFLEATGTSDSLSGFRYDQGGVFDVESPLAGTVSPFGLGSFFARTEPVGSGNNSLNGDGLFVIEYTSGAPTRASGQIWDIDGGGSATSEQYRVKAWSADFTELAVDVSPLGITNGASSLDGLPWDFTIVSPGDLVAIKFITINFIGSKTSNIGLAFDNFNATGSVIPEPSLFALLGGLAALFVVGTRRRRL